MVLIELFFSFLLIGFTSFGGLSMIPIINSEMIRHGWMTALEVSDIVAIAEMTPGPLGINSATFAGIRVAGIPGALAATLGVLTPSITTTIIAAIFLKKFKDNHWMKSILYGIRPVSIGLILATILGLSLENYIARSSIHWQSAFIGITMAFLIYKFKLSVPKIIVIAAIMGIILVR